MINIPVPVLTIGLLGAANIFMALACYGHLKFPDVSLAVVILISWDIAPFVYCLQVPANRSAMAS